jgi:hypothetical protein
MSKSVDSAGPVDVPVMQRDESLESLSDKMRKGEPIGFLEAIAVINYQENLRREREANSLVARLKRWLRAA